MDWQEIIALSIVALTAFALAWRFWREFNPKKAPGQPGCGTSCDCITKAKPVLQPEVTPNNLAKDRHED